MAAHGLADAEREAAMNTGMDWVALFDALTHKNREVTRKELFDILLCMASTTSISDAAFKGCKKIVEQGEG